MFFSTRISTSTPPLSETLPKLKTVINEADAIVVGAGAGLSTAAGFTYAGARFKRYFADFEARFGFHDMYSGGFYPFPDLEMFWGYWSRMIWVNRYASIDGQINGGQTNANGIVHDSSKDASDDSPAAASLYQQLAALLKGKDYFVLTTNVDHQFQLAGIDKHRLFYTQGDYGLFQCSDPCHQKTYDNKAQVRAMVEAQGFEIGEGGALVYPSGDPAATNCDSASSGSNPASLNGNSTALNSNPASLGSNSISLAGGTDALGSGFRVSPRPKLHMRVPHELVPRCPICGKPMTTNLRCDNTFVEDNGWHAAAERYHEFLRRHEGMNVLYLELGVGANTPGIIKYPFWQYTAANPQATYACINKGEACCPGDIEHQSILIDAGADEVIPTLLK